MKRALCLCLAALLGCVGESSVTCGDNVQKAVVAADECLCNCPDDVPERRTDAGGDFCEGVPDEQHVTCCFWQSPHVLLVGACMGQVCVVPIEPQ